MDIGSPIKYQSEKVPNESSLENSPQKNRRNWLSKERTKSEEKDLKIKIKRSE